MNISINTAAIAQLNGMGRRMPEVREAVLDRAAQVTLHAKQRTVRRTYKRAIPRSKTGRALWERSSAMLNGQVIERRRGVRIIHTAGAAAKYEGRLANLPTGADGVNRTNPAAEDAHRIVEPQIQAIAENEIKESLNL